MSFSNCKYNINVTERIGGLDRSILINLYQPIIGSSAMGLYLTLIQESELTQKMNGPTFQISRLICLTASTEKQLEKNLKKLEALKLVKTLISKKTENRMFNVFAPLDPLTFFNNDVFNRTLMAKLGEENYEATKFIYKNRVANNDDEFEDVTADFSEIFIDDFKTYGTYASENDDEINNITKRDSQLFEKIMNVDIFKQELNNRELSLDLEDMNTRKILNSILSVKTLTETQMAELISKAYDKVTNDIKNNVIETELLKVITESKKAVKKDLTDTGIKKIYEMNSFECETYYEMLTNEVASFTLKKSLREIVDEFNITTGMLNCLMEYSYYKNDEKVVINYIRKIAESIVEDGLTTAEEVMIYLRQVNNNKKQKREKISKHFVRKNNKETNEQIEFEKFDFDKYSEDDLTNDKILAIAEEL
ncbi:DnaD domain protein [[Acholeplasma] multilocale]|uniref:DnaD domain protein n=1 Tax=[Acholeplasma] multilocale TaxID=264638 RepID=UPI0003FDBCC6|nr:DnaD domain protein [[Acholeplasma] multilocale]